LLIGLPSGFGFYFGSSNVGVTPRMTRIPRDMRGDHGGRATNYPQNGEFRFPLT
jgi:hypothetical protein